MNRILNEYLKKVNNEKENLIAVKSRLSKNTHKKSKIINIVAIILFVILLGNFSPKIYGKFQQNVKYREYIRRDYVSGKGEIATAYSEKIGMDYVFQNNIGVKIDSIIMTDDSFKANINFKLPEEMRPDKLIETDSENATVFYSFGYAIYDEENNILGCSTRLNPTNPSAYRDYFKYLYKELGIKYDVNNVMGLSLANATGCGMVEKDDEKIILNLELNSLKGFPNSKKIYIRIFDIGYVVYKYKANGEFSQSNNFEWIFEIETPDKFLKRETINLVLLDEIPRLKISKFTISETGMILKGQKKDIVQTMAARKRYGQLGRSSRCTNKYYR